jgi:hypothetical protein
MTVSAQLPAAEGRPSRWLTLCALGRGLAAVPGRYGWVYLVRITALVLLIWFNAVVVALVVGIVGLLVRPPSWGSAVTVAAGVLGAILLRIAVRYLVAYWRVRESGMP